MRKNRKYSKAECLSYLEEYMCSSQNHSEFEREKGLKRTTISRWLRIFGIEDKPSPIMSKKLSQTEQELHDRIHELERKIKSLEVELKQSNMARDAYDYMIDLVEKTYNIPVRKTPVPSNPGPVSRRTPLSRASALQIAWHISTGILQA